MTAEHRRHLIIPQDLWEQIVAQARREDRNYSQVVRSALRRYLMDSAPEER